MLKQGPLSLLELCDSGVAGGCKVAEEADLNLVLARLQGCASHLPLRLHALVTRLPSLLNAMMSQESFTLVCFLLRAVSLTTHPAAAAKEP